MNRGSHEVDEAEVRRIVASMRPRFMNRGSQGTDIRDRPAASRFNEAPIHESGK